MREYYGDYEVNVDVKLNGRYVLRVTDNNENIAELDLLDVIDHLKENRPKLLK